jgi:glycosyltransferase involved in cell wall biosynthesis
MKKLCIISRYFPPDSIGGGEFVAYNIWKFAKKDFDTQLIAGYLHDPALLPKGAQKIDLSGAGRFHRYINFYIECQRIIREIKPDIIHSNATEIPLTNIPTIITVHHVSHLINGTEGLNPYGKMRTWVQKTLLKHRLENAPIIVADTIATRQDLIRLGIDGRKISVIHLGIDTGKFRTGNVKKSKFCILIPSRLSREKGQLVAISAFEKLPRKVRDKCELLIVGFVSDKKYLRELESRAYGIGAKVVPNAKSLIPYLHRADIVVFPSLIDEGFGLVPVEAMACGKPVIASESPAVMEVLGQCGIIVKKGDVLGLRDAIVGLYGNKKKRIRLAKIGRSRAVKNFSWKATYLNYKKMYDKILSK